ncbi:MAG: hypothetical protein QW130_04290, partial [Sulfolobales archaeon]
CSKPPGLELDGSPVPLGSTATHEPIQIPISVWARWKSLDTKELKQTKINIQGQTDGVVPIDSSNSYYLRVAGRAERG